MEKPVKTINSMIPLKSYSGGTIPHHGVAKLQCSAGSSTRRFDFFVVDTKAPPIFSLHASTCLGLIQKGPNSRLLSVEAVTSVASPQPDLTLDKVKADYADLFTGLGKFDTLYHIELDPSIQPVIEPPRRVPLSLHECLKAKLLDMEVHGIISKVDGPMDWVHNLVIVEKKDKSLHLCLDPRNFNKAMKREHHFIPTPDEVMGQLAGKKVFSIFDQKDSFWQVQLDQESALKCTFNSLLGCHCFNRLLLSVTSASELLQERNESTFGDIYGVFCIADDMILSATTPTEHNAIARKVLDGARQKNVKFNPNNIQWKVAEVKYMDHVLTSAGVRLDEDKVQAMLELPTLQSRLELQRVLNSLNPLLTRVPLHTSMGRPRAISTPKIVGTAGVGSWR